MRSSTQSAAAARKRQDEQNGQAIRRGLHPPHRVKSISMATFTVEEVDRLKQMGNAANASIYLGLYDGKTKFEPRVDEEVRAHLVEKYENRRWYVSPDDVEMQKRLLEEHAAQRRNSFSQQSVKSHKSNKSAPPNLHTTKPNGPVDILTGDLFDLCFDSQPSTTSNETTAPPPIPATKPTKVVDDDDWTTLFTDPQPKPPLAPASSLPFAQTQPAPFQYHPPQQLLPPPKHKEHSASPSRPAPSATHSVTFADFDSKPIQQTSTVPAGWESFTSNFPKSATVDTMSSNFAQPNQQQPRTVEFSDFFTTAPKKVPPPLPQSKPVATPHNAGAQVPDTDWNPFLS